MGGRGDRNKSNNIIDLLSAESVLVQQIICYREDLFFYSEYWGLVQIQEF